MAKADNMLSILWLLKQRKRMTASEIADELEINVRTVYRYIDALCASGVPIVSDSGHNGGYSLLHHFAEAPLVFDLEEQKAIMHAATFAKEAGYPFSDALTRAVTKLKMYANQEQLNQINRHTMGFDVIQPPVRTELEATLKELEVSVANGRTLQMAYQRGCEPAKTRRIDPYGLVYWKQRWYVMAYCHLRGEVRSFRVDRIQELCRTDSTFERPAEFSARRDFLKNLLPDPDNPEQLISIRIQGRQQALNDLCEHWLLGHALVERSLEHAHFRLEEQAIRTFLPYFLMPYGKAIQVLEPPLLKERLVAVASELLQYYQN
ncbi:helix-turn-helix transcriptional regulator [Brevibacillus sp. B_LB10_24]|uniref:helix-turn-helix transcriptional regulator n=1 Tax=Brevibacillus sp. B_LB10_24 TaxID=3380645 RepID=UPI0038BCC102